METENNVVVEFTSLHVITSRMKTAEPGEEDEMDINRITRHKLMAEAEASVTVIGNCQHLLVSEAVEPSQDNQICIADTLSQPPTIQTLPSTSFTSVSQNHVEPACKKRNYAGLIVNGRKKI